MQSIILGILRTVLATAGGGAVAKGYLNAEMLSQVIGAVMVLATAGWSVYDKLTRKE